MSQALAYALGIAVMVAGIAVSVALHELGHMLPAKKFGVKVPEYFIGFGPRLWSVRRGETEYGVKALWLGGYVKLVGMLPPENPDRPDRRTSSGELGMVGQARADSMEEIAPGEEARAFYRLSVPRKLVVMAGGILTNLLLGVVLLAVSLGVVGVPTSTSSLATVAPCVSSDIDAAAPCTEEDPESPAARAGLEPGDRIISWNGVPVSTWQEVTAQIERAGTTPAEVVVERDGALSAVSVTAVEVERAVRDDQGSPVTDSTGTVLTRSRPYVGVAPATEIRRVPLGELPGMVAQAVGGTLRAIATLPVGLYHVVAAGLGLEERSTTGVIGLVGLGRYAGQVSSTGVGEGTVPFAGRVSAMLSLLGSLNLALFAFNLVPLLPLDGGHVAGACWEGLRRRWAAVRGQPDPGPVDIARLLPVSQVVFALLVVMAVVLVWADLVAPVT
ncbi:RIP metalloprotease [Actinomyces sp. 2119]|uniref:M50 family metallopeptidase n=1 Tax=Actinomyces sp. 2119 TaxID=2321393 RepID=UPI000E6B8AAE|nr:site-2 protease family protein [Actinomyces sp. 2119]RJF43085.1 RIP metalloprotease [Actinomyces sp. 2119]